MKNKFKNVVDFYVLTNKLKDLPRTGWKNLGVKPEEIESVAEHIYSSLMLAVALDSEFDYGLNLHKVVLMLALHELEEIFIGDLTPFDAMSKEERIKKGDEAIREVLKNLAKKDEIENTMKEYFAGQSKEAHFCRMIDKLDPDIQCKIYDEKGVIGISPELSVNFIKDGKVDNKNQTVSDIWISARQKRYKYEGIYLQLAEYIKKNKITKN